MSFASELKDEIINFQYKNSCCRRALLQGVVAAKGNCDESFNISFNIENPAYANYICSLVKEFFGTVPTVSSSLKGGRCKTVSFKSKSMKAFLDTFEHSSGEVNFKCPFCQSAFLRGIFLACGRISDPSKQFCLEFSAGNKINLLSESFCCNGIDLKGTSRKTENILYSKNSTVIEDFLALLELHDAAFKVMNVKIANELKNDANRLRNFDTVNISKAVEAAGAQYALIKELEENNLLSMLPEELLQTAKLRLRNPDMSLSRLAINSIPPISKSGITHRMQKIMKLGEELLSKKKHL